jgi:xanthine dehydrogenase large subunit
MVGMVAGARWAVDLLLPRQARRQSEADLLGRADTLHLYVAISTRPHARIVALDVSRVRQQPGVVCVLTAADIPGVNDASPIFGDDPVFAVDEVQYAGQSIFAVAAETIESARAAAKLARIEYDDLPALITIDDALAANADLLPPQTMRLGDVDAALRKAPHRISGNVRTGGQDHFYLEGQIAYAIPGEDKNMLVHSSTQHPSEVQHNVAKVLALPDHAVTVEVRRMGGAFGGKESQPSLFAAIAAIAAYKTGRPAKLRVDRDDDMIITGKRHDFRIDYEVGFDDNGRILGVRFEQAARCGYSADLSSAVADRAMTHADNAYELHNATVHSRRMKTHTVSNTAFRGFGGPQGMLGMERVIDEIAFALDRDPLDIRKANFYPSKGGGITPYHMEITDSIIAEMVEDLEASSDYRRRRAATREFNRKNPVLKKGIALTPVKFGISFNKAYLNQAGALVHIYKDGSVQLNHGGTEMGQGVLVKVAQVVAEEFQIDIGRVKITAPPQQRSPTPRRPRPHPVPTSTAWPREMPRERSSSG